MASTTKNIKNERLTSRYMAQEAESIMGPATKEERLSKPYWEGETSKQLEPAKSKEYLENTTTGAINSMEDETKEEISQAQPAGSDFDDFDFVDHYGEETLDNSDDLLPDNSAPSAISCGFVGVGGGGGKMAKAFLDLGFNKTLLINTTEKDQPEGILPEHFLLLEGADGVGKDVDLGKRVLSENSAVVENTLRSKFGKKERYEQQT